MWGHREHCTRRFAQNLFSHRTKHEMLKAARAVGPHHHEIGTKGVCTLKNHGTRAADLNVHIDLDPR